MSRSNINLVVCTLALLSASGTALAQTPVGTVFTYQGELSNGGVPVDEPVDGCGFEFTLWDADVDGSQVGPLLTPNALVADGRFTLALDFEGDIFTGDARWLKIAVCCPSPCDDFTTLVPRQELTPAPYSLRASNGVGGPQALNVDATGNVSIGTTAVGNSLKLRVAGRIAAEFGTAANATYRFGSGSENTGFSSPSVDRIALITSGSERVTIRPNGQVGIGTASPGFLLEVDGDAAKPGGGSWSSASDRRLKKNIEDLHGALEGLLALRGVTFEYKDPESINELTGERIGMIAQEVEEVFPDWVDVNGRGHKTVTYRGFEALAVEAIKAQQAQIESLKNRNVELTARLTGVEALLAELTQSSSGGAR